MESYSMAIKSKTELKTEVGKNKLQKQLLIDMIDSFLIIDENTKSGIDQSAAGALAGEIWIDTNDNSIKIGV